jgi:hypothetical protein
MTLREGRGGQTRLAVIFAMLLLACCLEGAYGATLTSITYGSPARTMTNTPSATNVIPQVANVQLTYGGTLPAAKWVALVDSTVNSGTPCVGAQAAAVDAPSMRSSGSVQASGAKVVTIPQHDSDQQQQLNDEKSFAVCFAETDGTATDATWTDST